MSEFFEELMRGLNEAVEIEKGTNHPTGTACRLISMLENKTFTSLPFVHKVAIL